MSLIDLFLVAIVSYKFRNNKIIEIPCLFEEIGKTYCPKKNEITKLGTFINIFKVLELKKSNTKTIRLMN